MSRSAACVSWGVKRIVTKETKEQSMSNLRRVYTPPAILYEGRLQTQAGTPGSIIIDDEIDPELPDKPVGEPSGRGDPPRPPKPAPDPGSGGGGDPPRPPKP